MQEGEREPTKLLVSESQESPMFVLASSHFLNNHKNLKENLQIEQITYAGSIGVKLALICEGKGDVFFNTSRSIKEWDTCAPQIILEEAGGVMTDLFGRSLLYNEQDIRHHYGLIASNGQEHKRVQEVLERFARVEKGWRLE